MNAGWKIFWLAAAVFGVAFGAERLFVPGIAPVGFADEPQPLWSLETAFVLRAIELMTAGVAVIALTLMIAAWAKDLMAQRTL